MELFYRDLLNLKESAVVISPIDRCNAYVSYSFETLLNTKQRTPSIKINTERFINDLIELLPKNNWKCSCCENKASYTWCSSELFKNNDPFEWVAEKDARFESTYYCKECLIRIFQMKIAEGNIKFEFAYPPIEGKGFLCSWEV